MYFNIAPLLTFLEKKKKILYTILKEHRQRLFNFKTK